MPGSRMGAVLTYARRYALFTLVGIAGGMILMRLISAMSRSRRQWSTARLIS
jgi:hypothetical protein